MVTALLLALGVFPFTKGKIPFFEPTPTKESKQITQKSSSPTPTPVTQVISVEPKRIPVQPKVVPTNSETQTKKAKQQREGLKRKAKQQKEARKKRAEQQKEWRRRGQGKVKGKGKG